MSVSEIYSNDILLAKVITSKSFDADGLNFYSDDKDFIQVGSWTYNSGKTLAKHRHNRVVRSVTHTQEVLIINSGAIEVEIYGFEDELIKRFNAKTGDVVILLNGGHGYNILEDSTKVIEIKNGPYVGADADRTRF